MSSVQDVSNNVADVILVDRFTRLNQSVTGKLSPEDLPRLADYLAGADGEITYRLSGYRQTDPTGSQKCCVKCIISGWFLLADPVTSKAVRHDCSIESKLVVVSDESALPPLDLESDDEDYIVAGTELNVLERVEEEILLDLPGAYAGKNGAPDASGIQAKRPIAGLKPAGAELPAKKISPFAQLADWKKK